MKALCSFCYTSNVECTLFGRQVICAICKPKHTEKLPTGMKYPNQDRFKERWDEST